jgi:hypothetical protein
LMGTNGVRVEGGLIVSSGWECWRCRRWVCYLECDIECDIGVGDKIEIEMMLIEKLSLVWRRTITMTNVTTWGRGGSGGVMMID